MTQEIIKTKFDLGDKLTICNNIKSREGDWIDPSDLSKFAPYGSGSYGYQEAKNDHPFKSAPSEDACGGVIYFDNNITKDDFKALMRITGVEPEREFAIFTQESAQPGKEGYLTQMRLVSSSALKCMFRAISDDEYENFPQQTMSTVDAMWLFIEIEKKRWGTSFLNDKRNGLRGLFGGDGDYEREQLSFGFMRENNYHDISRIWSRAWLVTK